MDMNFIRKNLRSFLRIPENVTPGVTASLPTALGGSPPELSMTRPAPVAPSAPAPVASVATPKFRRAPVGANGLTAYQEKMRFEARLKTEFGYHEKMATAGMDSTARRKVLADFDRYVAARPMGKSAPPATDDDGTPVQTASPDDSENPPGIDEILSQLLDLLTELKKQVQSNPADDDEAVVALGHFAAGRKLTASRQLMALTQRLCKAPKLTPGQKISRGFSAQSGVQAIQACLRPGPRQHTAPAPAAISTPAAVVAPSGSRDRVQALRAELAQVDKDQRRLGFTNERNAKHAQLSATLKAELKKFHVQ